MWAIARFGYPFDFLTEDLTNSSDIVTRLIDLNLVEENTNSEKTYNDEPFEFALINIDFWQQCFIYYICDTRSLSGHLGYVPIIKPNFSWHIQHIGCLWEHCIEFMPLPPIPRSERLEHLEFIRQQFNIGAYEKKTPEEKLFLQQMLDKGVPENAAENRDLEMEASSCPIFGHCCAGGKTQADECRKELSDFPDNELTDTSQNKIRNKSIFNFKTILFFATIIAGLIIIFYMLTKKWLTHP